MALLIGRDVLDRAFQAIYGMDALVDNYALTYANLGHCVEMREAELHLLTSLERYIAQTRVQLAEKFGPFTADQLDVGTQKMMQLNGLVGLFNIPRTFIWLYLHVHLYALVFENAEYLDRFEALLVDVTPA